MSGTELAYRPRYWPRPALRDVRPCDVRGVQERRRGGGNRRGGCYAMSGTEIAVCLRRCYAMSGTEMGCDSGTELAICLRGCYATSGTEIGYGAMRRAVRGRGGNGVRGAEREGEG
eukprot:1655440-Rhodomonas_salina.3